MSNWEVKDLWSKSNGDLVLTVGPSIDSNEGMSAFLCISLYLLALWNLWPVHGAGALILGVIHVFLYVIACFAAFFVNFWMALLWLVPITAGVAVAVGEDIPLIVKIPCFLLWMWGLNGLIHLFPWD